MDLFAPLFGFFLANSAAITLKNPVPLFEREAKNRSFSSFDGPVTTSLISLLSFTDCMISKVVQTIEQVTKFYRKYKLLPERKFES